MKKNNITSGIISALKTKTGTLGIILVAVLVLTGGSIAKAQVSSSFVDLVAERVVERLLGGAAIEAGPPGGEVLGASNRPIRYVYDFQNGVYVNGVELFDANGDFVGTYEFAADIDPNANNTYDLGLFGASWKDVYASGTLYAATTTIVAGDLDVDAGTLLVDESANRVGVTTSTPSADFSVGESVSATTTLDFAKPCFRVTATDGTLLYLWPELNANDYSNWATSTVSCF